MLFPVFVTISLLATLEASPVSISRFGDVFIRRDGEIFDCDMITCPKGTARCQVTKFPEEGNKSILVRRNVCYDQSDNILLQKETTSNINPGQEEYLNVNISGNGVSSSSSSGQSIVIGPRGNFITDANIDTKKLNEDIQRNVQEILDGVNENLKQNLGGLWHGF